MKNITKEQFIERINDQFEFDCKISRVWSEYDSTTKKTDFYAMIIDYKHEIISTAAGIDNPAMYRIVYYFGLTNVMDSTRLLTHDEAKDKIVSLMFFGYERKNK